MIENLQKIVQDQTPHSEGNIDIRKFDTLDVALEDLVLEKSALQSTQCKCLSKYLTELNAQSIVVEQEYNDGGYLSEYANYYSRCHDDYDRFTCRVHFFELEPNELSEKFVKALISIPNQTEDEILSTSYLGFIVLKPLPQTIIGRTCLKPYYDIAKSSHIERHYPILREYGISLYGIRLSIKSVAFQEQDNEVAACSTAAIWYALHSLTNKITTEEIASTYEITNQASATYIKRNLGEVARRFPTSGLGLEQIEAYLRTIGMECIVCGATLDRESSQAAEYLAAYAAAGYPMILVGNLYVSNEKTRRYRKLGLHAMTALGYATNSKFKPGNKASRIEKIYAHDDNVGPFTSYHIRSCKPGEFAKFTAEEISSPADDSTKIIEKIKQTKNQSPTTVEEKITGFLENESGLKNGGVTFRKFTPEYFIVPVAPKVRLPYEGIMLFASQIQETYRTTAPQRYAPGTKPPEISWEIKLKTNKELKSGLREYRSIGDQEAIIELLTSPLPKHLWILSFSNEESEKTNSPILDLIFDATALRQSGGLLGFLTHDKVKDFETFEGIVFSAILAYNNDLIDKMDSELQPIMKNAKILLESQLSSQY